VPTGCFTRRSLGGRCHRVGYLLDVECNRGLRDLAVPVRTTMSRYRIPDIAERLAQISGQLPVRAPQNARSMLVDTLDHSGGGPLHQVLSPRQRAGAARLGQRGGDRDTLAVGADHGAVPGADVFDGELVAD
jgi:hypothetical protein